MGLARGTALQSRFGRVWHPLSSERTAISLASLALLAIWVYAWCVSPCLGGDGSTSETVTPLLGRPTDRSVTVNVASTLEADFYAAYGERAGACSLLTAPRHCGASKSVEIVIDGLDPGRTYFYKVMRRLTGDTVPTQLAAGRFHTRRPPGSAFIFTVQADAHVSPRLVEEKGARARQYNLTMASVLAEGPDFNIDLGDFAGIEYRGRNARSLRDATSRYLAVRYCLGTISPSVPFFLVLGNHEAEQGWRYRETNDSLPVWATLARESLVPNPFPDGFYSGNTDTTGCCGLQEDYYAWEWGDALFVVLDPFLYTTVRPQGVVGTTKPSLDGWNWTLGEAQYDWLYDTLHRSSARWKFVFAHHMTGGVLGTKAGEGYYGRGGIDAARYNVAHHPTFEWGGEDSSGTFVFAEKRPGWEHGPIHQMMAEGGVDIFFRGHDHVFVYETLDGIVYQTCPTPRDFRYSDGYFSPSYFSTGIEVNAPGHLRVSVWPDSVRVDYVRSILPEDEPLHEGSGWCATATYPILIP
jgi:hypothetical protein